MKSYKVLIVVVVVLVLVNCALLGAFWLKRDNWAPRNGRPQGPPDEYLSKELKLTPQQVKTYNEMRNQHFRFTRKLNEENRMLRDSFFEHIKTPVLNTGAVETLEKKITANQVILDTATLQHFRKFRSILNHDQQEKFDHVLKNIVHMMSGAPQGGRNGRPGPPNGMPPPGGGPEGRGGPGKGPRPGDGPGPGGEGPPPYGPPGGN